MHRISLLSFLLLAVAAASCGGNDDSGSTSTTALFDDTTAAPTTAPVTTTEFVPDTGEIRLDVPSLWRAVTSPPDGADAAWYAPSDNNFVAERLLLTRTPLDATDSDAEQAEAAVNDLEQNFSAVSVLDTARANVGTDGAPAQQIRFTWEQPGEAGVGWRWVVRAETELIYLTFLADLSEPQLYLPAVQTILDTARLGR